MSKTAELSATFDYFAFENKIRKMVEDAYKPIEELIESERRELQFLRASMQHMATRIDDIDHQTERASKKANEVFDLKSKILG